MIREKVSYREDLPVNVLVAEIEKWQTHFHEDMEIVYMLQGNVRLKSGYYTHDLRRGDVFIINGNETHSFNSCGKGNMIMLLQINMSYFAEYHPDLKSSFFMIDKRDSEKESLSLLRDELTRIMMEILEKGYDYEEKVIESIHNLLGDRLSEFRYSYYEDATGKEQGRNNIILARRLARITSYMYENYNRKLTLNEIAYKEGLSIYYLSHMIREATGLSFQELLNYIRVEESEELLLNTEKRIGLIAEEMGFSAIRYYIKHFEFWFGRTPSEYREKKGDKNLKKKCEVKYTRTSPRAIEEAIKDNVGDMYNEFLLEQHRPPVIVDINLKELKGYRKESSFSEAFLEKEAMKQLARPYNLLRSLKESIIKSNRNYLITTSSKDPENIKSMSVLVYNITEGMEKSLQSEKLREEVLDKIKAFNAETEFLLKIKGLHGDYRISRYKMTKENVIVAYEDAINQQSGQTHVGRRQIIVNNWSTLPNITFRQMSILGTLNLRSILSGASAELILIDKVE